jgi:hypothetical protein
VPPKAKASAKASFVLFFISIAPFSLNASLILFRLVLLQGKSPAPQGAFLHQREKHGHENQYVNRGRDHAAHDGCGNWFHDVGADAVIRARRQVLVQTKVRAAGEE